MFNCRACSNSPFGEFFGCGNTQAPQRNVGGSDGSESEQTAETENTDTEDTENSQNSDLSEEPHDEDIFIPRNEREAKEACLSWMKFAHPRAGRIWTRQQINDMLATIASNVDRDEDPITGHPEENDQCIVWQGKVSEKDVAVMEVSKPGQPQPTETYVSRAYAFLYADQESLDSMKGGGFSMACGTPDCVRLSHLQGHTELWGLKYSAEGYPAGPNHQGIMPAGALPKRLQLGDVAPTKASAKRSSR